MLVFAEQLRAKGAGLRVLNLCGGDVDTHTSMGSMVFTVMVALAQMELRMKRERFMESVAKRRAAGKDLGGRRQTFTDSQIRNAIRLIEGECRTIMCHPLWLVRGVGMAKVRECGNAVIGRTVDSKCTRALKFMTLHNHPYRLVCGKLWVNRKSGSDYKSKALLCVRKGG